VTTPTKKRCPTFADLIALEPRLAALEREVRAVRDEDAPVFCANGLWYGYGGYRGIKPRLSQLVGFETCRKDLIGTPLAYDVAYDHLYELLPDCRGACSCLPWSPLAATTPRHRPGG
jgi:hypothetical protein